MSKKQQYLKKITKPYNFVYKLHNCLITSLETNISLETVCLGKHDISKILIIENQTFNNQLQPYQLINLNYVK